MSSRAATAAFALLALIACDPPKQPASVTTEDLKLTAPNPKPVSVAVHAQELSQRLVIVDGHVDLPFRLHEGRNPDGSLSEDVTLRTEKGNFDWVRARAGGLDAPFMSIYVPSSFEETGGARALADDLIDMVEGLAERAPEKFALAHTVGDVERAFASKRVALPMGIENGAALEGSLENLRHFHARGVRYITLTHAKDNDICDSSYDDRHTHHGLSSFGREVVAEMNRLGVMIDVSHISDDAFWQVMDESVTPVIASHSSCRHFTPGFERNMSDDMITRLAKGGGVVMINYGSTFLTARARQWSDQLDADRSMFMTSEGIVDKSDPRVASWMAAYEKQHPLPYATVSDVADHVMHVVGLVGIEHVGLGSDFDGVGDSLPDGLKDASQLPALLSELLRRGLTEVDIAKVCGLNSLRVWADVEAHAAKAPMEPQPQD